MKKFLNIFSHNYVYLILSMYCIVLASSWQCGVPGIILGGKADSMAPIILSSNIAYKQLKVPISTKKIQWFCNEFVQIKDASKVFINPSFKVPLDVFFNRRCVTIKLDSIKNNTTYKINFEDNFQDLNEGNSIKNFEWIFSTGKKIDSFSLNGIVIDAESNSIDSNINVVLYSVINDSVIFKEKPDYISKTNNKGRFEFTYLKPKTYQLFALENAETGGVYSSPKLKFGFLDSSIKVEQRDSVFLLRTYKEKKEEKKTEIKDLFKNGKKIATHKVEIINNTQTLEKPLIISFNSSTKKMNFNELLLCDTAIEYCIPLNTFIHNDTTTNVLQVNFPWQSDTQYVMLLPKKLYLDSALYIAKDDTILIKTLALKKYGKASFIWNDSSINFPLMRILLGDKIIECIPLLKNKKMNTPLLLPGKYIIDVINDANHNLLWDIGNYKMKTQPEFIFQLKEPMIIVEDKVNAYFPIIKKQSSELHTQSEVETNFINKSEYDN